MSDEQPYDEEANDYIFSTRKYLDSHGLMRMHPLIPSENGILFRAYYDFWESMEFIAEYGKVKIGRGGMYHETASGHTAINMSFYQENLKEIYFRANPPERGNHFSRDNMWGLYCMHLMYGKPINWLPIFKWNHSKKERKRTVWWHPNGWMVFLSLRSRFWKVIFFLPLLLMRTFSFFDNLDEDSSGACLWTMMDFFLYGLMPNERDCKEFEQYCTKNYEWDLPDQPILKRVANYKSRRFK